MHNVTHKVEDGKLIITVNIGPDSCAAAPPSSSGKTALVGTTSGNQSVVSPKGWQVFYSINVMAKKN